jgi:AAA domain
VINPRSMAVLIRNRATNQFEDRTPGVSKFRTVGQRIEIVFTDSNRTFPYERDRVRILCDPEQHSLTEGERVEVDGTTWQTAAEVLTFTDIGGAWSRVFYGTQAGERYSTYSASQVRVVASATQTPAVARVLRYWHTVVSRLPRDDPLRPRYEKLAFVHPESVLNSFLSGSPIESRSQDITPIFPFRCNLSQRAAVKKALTRSVSVIEGPPGTGKTETILNLIANIVAVQHMTVGIVSFGNAAVDNVRDKLGELGFGHVIGNLGRKEKRDEFFAGQADRDTAVAQFLERYSKPHVIEKKKRPRAASNASS